MSQSLKSPRYKSLAHFATKYEELRMPVGMNKAQKSGHISGRLKKLGKAATRSKNSLPKLPNSYRRVIPRLGTIKNLRLNK